MRKVGSGPGGNDGAVAGEPEGGEEQERAEEVSRFPAGALGDAEQVAEDGAVGPGVTGSGRDQAGEESLPAEETGQLAADPGAGYAVAAL